MKAILTLVITVIFISSCATTGGGRMCDPDINAVVTDVLNQSLNPDDPIRLPDQTFASQYGFTFLLGKIEENRCNISDIAFSSLAKEQYRLVNKRQLNSEARKHDGKLVYMRVESVEIDGDVARMWVGASINFSPKSNVGLLCCCSGEMILDRSADRWIFREWGLSVCG